MASTWRIWLGIVASQPLALAGPAGQRHEIDEFDGSGGELFGLEERGEMVQARVGDLHHGHVGFLGALMRNVGPSGLTEQIEERGLSYSGQTDDSDAHDREPLECGCDRNTGGRLRRDPRRGSQRRPGGYSADQPRNRRRSVA